VVDLSSVSRVCTPWLFATPAPVGSYDVAVLVGKDARSIDGRSMKQPIARDAIRPALHTEKLHSQTRRAHCC
jgi:hypothetical protein